MLDDLLVRLPVARDFGLSLSAVERRERDFQPLGGQAIRHHLSPFDNRDPLAELCAALAGVLRSALVVRIDVVRGDR